MATSEGTRREVADGGEDQYATPEARSRFGADLAKVSAWVDALMVASVVGCVLDAVTTALFLHYGAREANPVLGAALGAVGVPVALVLRVLIGAVVMCGAASAAHELALRKALLWPLVAVTGMVGLVLGVVVWNALVIVRVAS